jgi:hypothetical protein
MVAARMALQLVVCHHALPAGNGKSVSTSISNRASPIRKSAHISETAAIRARPGAAAISTNANQPGRRTRGKTQDRQHLTAQPLAEPGVGDRERRCFLNPRAA